MAAGAFDPGTSDLHDVAGIWNETDGVFQPTNGTFTFTGTGGKTIVQDAGNKFNNLTIASGGIHKISANSDISVGGVFTNTNGTFDTEGNTVTVTGVTNIDGGILEIAAGTFDADNTFDANGANVTFTGTGILKLGGGTVDLGTLDATTNDGTVEYDFDGVQGVFDATYHHLEIDNNTGTATAGSALGVEGNLTVTTGNLTLNNIALTLGGNFVLTSGTFVPGNADHTVAGDWTETGGTTFEPTAGKFTFTGDTKTITTDAAGGNKFFNLFINPGGGNTINAGSNLDIDGDFELTSGTFSPVDFNHTVSGNWSDVGGTFTAGSGTGKITFNGGTNTTIESGATNDFHHFEINTGEKTVITNNLDIDGDFTITAGTFNPGALSQQVIGMVQEVHLLVVQVQLP